MRKNEPDADERTIRLKPMTRNMNNINMINKTNNTPNFTKVNFTLNKLFDIQISLALLIIQY